MNDDQQIENKILELQKQKEQMLIISKLGMDKSTFDITIRAITLLDRQIELLRFTISRSAENV